MRVVASLIGRKSLVFVLLGLGACSSLRRAPGVMSSTGNSVREGTTPHITLIERPWRQDRFVDGAFQLDAEGYALVLAVDLDGRVRVVFPESPEADGFAVAHESRQLTPFFAGNGHGIASDFWEPASAYYRPGLFPYQHTRFPYRSGLSRSRGAVYLVAVVSARPLQLGQLRDGSGQWADDALRSVVFESDPTFVGSRLGQLVTLPDQQFTTDYRVIAGDVASPLYISSIYSQCGAFGAGYGPAYGYGFGYGFSPLLGLDPYSQRGTFFGATFGAGYPRFGAYPSGGVCGPSYIWDAPEDRLRRASPLFPNDTSLLFTTRRIAMRVPGASGGGLPGFFPGVTEQGDRGPDLSRGRTPTPRTAEPSPAQATRENPHKDADHASPANAPARTATRRH